MGNVLNMLKRDIVRLLKAPAALVVVAALMVLPSVYTWYNVVAFWNPYKATGNLEVSVVNQDSGTKQALVGELNVGERVVDELQQNEKLDFSVCDYDEAMADLRAGRVYAVYVIPAHFSESLVSPLSGQVENAQIEYYVNEKLGPVSPKITDTAANTLEQSINALFVSEVSEAVTNAVNEAVGDARADVSAARSNATARMGEAISAVEEAQAELDGVNSSIDEARSRVAAASGAMGDALTLAADAQGVVSDLQAQSALVESSLGTTASDGVSSLTSVLGELSRVSVDAETIADEYADEAGQAKASVDLLVERGSSVADKMEKASADVRAAADALPDSSPEKERLAAVSDELSQRAQQLQDIVGSAQALDGDLSDSSRAASELSSALKQSTDQVSQLAKTYSDELFSNLLPTASGSLTRIAGTVARLSAAVETLDSAARQAKAGLDQLDAILVDCQTAITRTRNIVAGFEGDLKQIRTDVDLLAASDAVTELLGQGALNVQSIGSFMKSPTELETREFYHPNSYGTAMAPLFMNLTFWIGAFMLMIIFRLEVDDEGLKNPKPSQRYLARYLLLAGIAVIQAVICCVGVMVLGVQVASPLALIAAGVVCSLAYLAIIYALSATFKHIGMALCIVLVFAQIPGGSGLYPLELTDAFFQAVYPVLPFSYGIDALRESIGGFYGLYYARDLAMLAFMLICATLCGLALVPLMSNVVRMVAMQIREGDLYNGEDAVVPTRPYRLVQVARALYDRDDYRDDLERRYARFNALYPAFIRAAIILGGGVPLALALLLALDAGEKVVLLTLFLLWLVALVVFLVVVESLRYSFERQLNIERMSGESLMRLFLNRDQMVPATGGAKDKEDGDA